MCLRFVYNSKAVTLYNSFFLLLPSDNDVAPRQNREAGWGSVGGCCQVLCFLLLSYRYLSPSLAGLFRVVSYCASLWFTELPLCPTAEPSSECSGCEPPLSVAQLQAQSVL